MRDSADCGLKQGNIKSFYFLDKTKIDCYPWTMILSYQSIYLYTYKTLITLIVCLFVCLFEAVHTNPGYGMAALIYNNLLNLISGTVILLRSS